MFKKLFSKSRKKAYGWAGNYPSWFFNEEGFLKHFSEKYKIVSEFSSYVKGEEIMLIDGVQSGYDKGFYLVN